VVVSVAHDGGDRGCEDTINGWIKVEVLATLVFNFECSASSGEGEETLVGNGESKGECVEGL
jgi:hypothetical protein